MKERKNIEFCNAKFERFSYIKEIRILPEIDAEDRFLT